MVVQMADCSVEHWVAQLVEMMAALMDTPKAAMLEQKMVVKKAVLKEMLKVVKMVAWMEDWKVDHSVHLMVALWEISNWVCMSQVDMGD